MKLRLLRVFIGTAIATLGAVAACSLNTQATNTGGFQNHDGGPDSTAAGGSGVGGSGTGGVSPTGGSGPTGGTGGGTAGSGGSGGATGGAGGIGGSSGAGGTGGTGGDACHGNCPSPDICTAGVCSCPAGYTDTDGNTSDDKATCTKSSIIQSLTVTVGIQSYHCGQLTIKLIGAGLPPLTLVSRPGATEAADDGSDTAGGGDTSNLETDHQITFDDAASTSAEDMGKTLGNYEVVCRDDGICNFSPSQGSWLTPTATLNGTFKGKDSSGIWELCVGDSILTTASYDGTLDNWTIKFNTVGGAVSKSATNINGAIPDDKYDGSLGSMACNQITIP